MTLLDTARNEAVTLLLQAAIEDLDTIKTRADEVATDIAIDLSLDSHRVTLANSAEHDLRDLAEWVTKLADDFTEGLALIKSELGVGR